MTIKLLKISDRTYEELVNIGKLIEQEDIERAGIKIRMTPEDVVSWLLGFASGANPQIHKIVFPNEKTREEEIGEMAKALGGFEPVVLPSCSIKESEDYLCSRWCIMTGVHRFVGLVILVIWVSLVYLVYLVR